MNTVLSILAQRIAQLPAVAQREAVSRLVEVENRYSIALPLSEQDLKDLDAGIAAYDRGDHVGHASVMAGLDRIIAA